MSTHHTGSCLCGAVSYSIAGAFEHFFLCHCSHCQKDTGSAHAANLFSTTARLTWTSGADHVETFTLDGTRHTKGFCKTCGSAVPTLQMEDTLLVVPAGSLDTQVDLQANAHIFTSSRAAWDDRLEQLPTFDTFPG